MCPMPCLQEAVAQSKEAANILMSPAERMLHSSERRELVDSGSLLLKKKKLHGGKGIFLKEE